MTPPSTWPTRSPSTSGAAACASSSWCASCCCAPEGERGPAAELVEDLFEHADEIIAREEYVGIEDAESFHTKLAGVTFEGRQELLESLEPGTPLRLERQPDNPHDYNAHVPCTIPPGRRSDSSTGASLRCLRP